MKKLFVGLLVLGSISSFAQSINWNQVALQASAMADMELCFERVLDNKEVASSCNDEIIRATEVGITKEQASMRLYEIAKYRIIAENSRAITDRALNEEIKKLVSVESIENILKNINQL